MKTKRIPLLLLLISLTNTWTGCSSSTAPDAPAKQASEPQSASNSTENRDKSDLFFEQPVVYRIKLQLSNGQERKLRDDPRQYVRCTMVEEGGPTLKDVGIKLKGAAGSFQELDDKPAFTINVDKFRKGQSFHSLDKLHLNNSVQDDTFTCEWLCMSLCQDLKIPAPRVAHARVWLNDRDLGLYVVKEGFDQRFLSRHFEDHDGNLYDGGFCQDIDAELERDEGTGVDDRSDLARLVAACAEEDQETKKRLLEQALDVDAFLSFMAFETMISHWDGYVCNANNYRLYFPPSDKPAIFLPHGMDQVFQDTEFSVFAEHSGMVARAVRSVPDWNSRYRECVRSMLPQFQTEKLSDRVNQVREKLRSTQLEMDPECGPSLDEIVSNWRSKLDERFHSIQRQLEEPDPQPEPQPEQEAEMGSDSEMEQKPEESNPEEPSVSESASEETAPDQL